MWIVFGGVAIVSTFINLYMYKCGKNYKIAMAVGLSFTSLTLCSQYTMISKWIKSNDFTALLDVIPYMETALWFLTIISIVLNIIPIFLEINAKK